MVRGRSSIGVVVLMAALLSFASHANASEPATTIDPATITAGGFHSCAIKTDGTIACWGNNNSGQLNNVPSGTYTAISAGFSHTCAIKTDGTLACWGDNTHSQLTNIPAGTFRAISAGDDHTCGIKTDGMLAC